MIQAINQYLSRYDLSIDELLTFRLEKTVTIQVWQVGFLYRILQIAIVTFFVFQMVVYDQWALVEIPVGSLNAWSQARNFKDDAGLSSFASLPYCNNASYAYTYDWELDYTTNGGPPVCEALADWEVVQKTGITAQSNSLIFMTVFIEKSEFAWPCAGPLNDSQTTKCLSDAGTLETTHGGSQCKCETQRTVYPVGVDKMGFAFEHNVKNGTNFADIGSNSHEVTDETANPPVYGIISKIRCANGTDIPVPPGASVGLSLQDWIRIASTGSAAVPQVSLDGAAADLKPDDTRNGRHPPFRTSGIALQIRVEYDNLNPNDGGAHPYNRQVYAKVTPSVTTSQWAGNGESSTLAKHRSAPKPSLSHLPSLPSRPLTFTRADHHHEAVPDWHSGPDVLRQSLPLSSGRRRHVQQRRQTLQIRLAILLVRAHHRQRYAACCEDGGGDVRDLRCGLRVRAEGRDDP